MQTEKKPLYLLTAIALLLFGLRLFDLGMMIGGTLSLLAAAILFHRSYQTPDV